MDISPKKKRVLSRLGVANAKVRAVQAQLYEDAVKETITLDTLKTHRHLLDTDIKIIFSEKFCSSIGWFERNYHLHIGSYHDYHTNEDSCEYVDMIKTGFCDCNTCKKAKSVGIDVAGLRLIHILVANDKHLPLIAFLHECGCDMNPSTLSEKFSPLQLAVRRKSKEIVKYFVQHFDCTEFTPTFEAALLESNHASITKTLLSAKNVSVDFCTGKDSSLLITCVKRSEYKCDDDIDHVRVFLEAGANLEKADEYGNRPLMIAAKYGCVETVRLLLKHGSAVNCMNDEGNTAMHYAALSEKSFWCGDNLHSFDYLDENEAKIVALLIENGADPDIPNKEGATPLWYAVSQDCFEVVQTLLAAGVKMNIKICGKEPEIPMFDFRGWYSPPEGVTQSLLEVALERADADIIKLLIEAGYDIQKETGMLNKESSRNNIYSYRYQDNMYQDLIDDWISSRESPRRLESLCRDKIRKCLGHKIHRKVEELDIPIPLKNGLLFKDVLPSQRRLDDRVDSEEEDCNQYLQELHGDETDDTSQSFVRTDSDR